MKLRYHVMFAVAIVAVMSALFAYIIITDNQPVDLYTRTGVPSPTVTYRLPYVIQPPHTDNADDHVFSVHPIVPSP